MLKCPKCEKRINFTLVRYLRDYYNLTCPDCETRSHVVLPWSLKCFELLFIVGGTVGFWKLAQFISALMGWPDSTGLRIVAILPWIIFTIYLNMVLDGKYGSLKEREQLPGGNADEQPGSPDNWNV